MRSKSLSKSKKQSYKNLILNSSKILQPCAELYKIYKLDSTISKLLQKHKLGVFLEEKVSVYAPWKLIRKIQKDHILKLNQQCTWAYNIDINKGTSLRVILPENLHKNKQKAKGTCVYIHGGGWCLGAKDLEDKILMEIANGTQYCVVSVGYRLAPEHPYPAGNEDCVSAVEAIRKGLWNKWAKTNKMVITGDSAGAHLALCTMITLTNKLGKCPFTKASLFFGVYAPHQPFDEREKYVLLTKKMMTRFQKAYSIDYSKDTMVDLSYTSLPVMCPTQFVVGTNDLMYRGNLDMYANWRSTGNTGDLLIFKGQPHAFTTIPHTAATEAKLCRIKYL